MVDKREETAESFSLRVNTMMADTMTMFSVSLGTDLGLIEKMISYREPKTCAEIAEDAGLKERYVEEWLSVMVMGRVVDLKPGGKFIIPQHRHSTIGNDGEAMASIATCLPRFGGAYDELVEAIKKDGPSGVSYDSYKGYHDWEFRSLESRFVNFMKSLDLVPGLVEQLSKGITVCDMGCSIGYITMPLAKKYPASQIHGVDVSEEAIPKAKKAAAEKSLTNCHFHLENASNMPAEWTEKWDFISMRDVLHDIPLATKAVSEMFRTLKKGGYISVVDINVHSNLRDNLGNQKAAAWYGYSLFQCLPTSLYYPGSEGLGAAWGKEKAERMIAQAGFTEVTVTELGSSMVIVAKKP